MVKNNKQLTSHLRTMPSIFCLPHQLPTPLCSALKCQPFWTPLPPGLGMSFANCVSWSESREGEKNEVGVVILPVPPWRWPQAGCDSSTKVTELVRWYPHTKYFWGPAMHPSFALWSLRKAMYLPMVSNSRIQHYYKTLSLCLRIVPLLSNSLQITQFEHTVYFIAKNLVESRSIFT